MSALEDTTECFTTCAYSSTPRYPNDNKCAQCQSNCFECSTGNSCRECSYTKKRISGSVTAANFLTKKANNQIVPSTDCNEGKVFKGSLMIKLLFRSRSNYNSKLLRYSSHLARYIPD